MCVPLLSPLKAHPLSPVETVCWRLCSAVTKCKDGKKIWSVFSCLLLKASGEWLCSPV